MAADASLLPEVCVVYIVRGHVASRSVILGIKKSGLGKGKIVAPGGKLELRESPGQAAIREIGEETSMTIDPGALRSVARIDYWFPAKPEWSQRSHVFLVDYSESMGKPLPSSELDVAWVPIERIPYDEMWADAKEWLPLVLAGVRVEAAFTFGDDNQQVSDRVIREKKPAISPHE